MTRRAEAVLVIAVCFVVSAAWFSLTWRWGFDLADEGFYWYGAQRLLEGEWPLYDFTAYDIGRYAWTAAWMWALNDSGIFVARLAAQTMLFPAWAYIAWLSVRDMPIARTPLQVSAWVTFVVLLLALWVRPYYKAADFVACLMVVASLDLVIRAPRKRSAFAAGVLLGLSAVIGRNHGLYGAVAALLGVALLLVRGVKLAHIVPLGGFFTLGVLFGFGPNLLLMVVAPEYGDGFLLSLRQMRELGTTNIALPVAWPWSLPWHTHGIVHTSVNRLPESLAFLAVALAPVWLALCMFSAHVRRPMPSRASPLFLACILAAVPYAHYAFSRADLTHLALSAYPLLLAALLAPIGRARYRGALLFVASAMIFTPTHPALTMGLMGKSSAIVVVNGVQIKATPHVEERYAAVTDILNATKAESFLALPHMPTLHAVRSEPMRVRDIYVLFRRSDAYQQTEIARLERDPPEVIVISTELLDGRPEMSFAVLAPLIAGWIGKQYELVRPPDAPDDLQVWRHRGRYRIP